MPYFIKMVAGLMSIINPLGSVPIFLGLSSDMTEPERNRSARMAAIAVAIILTVSALCGKEILEFFGIGLDSFRIGGGILIMLMAISMLHAKTTHIKHTPEEAEEATEKEDISIVPLAMPLLAGPGAISTVILYTNDIGGHGSFKLVSFTAVETAILTVSLSTWLFLRLAVPIGDRLGTTGINVASRIMGLILTAIAVEFIATGMKNMFPGLLH